MQQGVPQVQVGEKWCRRLRASAIFSLLLAGMMTTGCAKPLAKPQLHLSETSGSASQTTLAQNAPAELAPAGDDTEAIAAPQSGGATSPEIFAAAQQDPAPRPEGGPDEAELAGAGYRTIGGVLAEVNGKPIFTEDVIAAARNELRALARQHEDRSRFLQEAQAVIARELTGSIENEMLRLVAERNLSAKDRARAVEAATLFRVNRITAAGGSEARARQIALREEGLSLEKLVEDTEQRFLVMLFYQSVVTPRATPSADEVRDYYRRHPELSSAQGKGEIEFLLIEISAGEPEQRSLRAQHVHSLAAAGEDFEALAREYNDNPSYQERGGAVPGMPLGRGDFRWPAVDAAVWSTPEGQVTPVISEDNDRRLFIAKVTRRQDPQSVGFDKVQTYIHQLLTDERRKAILAEYLAQAQQYAATTEREQIARNLQTAMEVVAQEYETWRAQ